MSRRVPAVEGEVGVIEPPPAKAGRQLVGEVEPAGHDRGAAARQRAWRRRQASGERVFSLSLDEDRAAEVAISAGLLTEREAQDHRNVQRALEELARTRILGR